MADKCKVRPMNDRLVCRREEADSVTKGGIYIPDVAKDRPQRAVVLAVGPGEWSRDGAERLQPQVKVGDTILFTTYAGSDVEHEGEKYLILRECDVLAVVG